MQLFSVLSQLNYIAVILATLSSFIVGFIWYSETVFGKIWMKLVGLNQSDLSNNPNMGRTFAVTGVFSFFTAVTLGCLLIITNTTGLIDSKLFAFTLGLVFRAGAHVIHNGFAHSSP